MTPTIGFSETVNVPAAPIENLVISHAKPKRRKSNGVHPEA